MGFFILDPPHNNQVLLPVECSGIHNTPKTPILFFYKDHE